MRQKRISSERGFTLIELLVVIAIIGLLSSIVLASMNAARVNASATRTVRDFKEMEKAFVLLSHHENVTAWWNETAFGAGANPDISALVAQTTRLGRFLPQTPIPAYGTRFGFDSDNDTYTSCSAGTVNNGVNLVAFGMVTQAPSGYLSKIDSIIDRGDGASCGRFVWSTTDAIYKLGTNFANY